MKRSGAMTSPLPEPSGETVAESFVTRLRDSLRQVEAELQEHEQLLVRAVAGVREVVVDFIAYQNPDLVVVDGVDPTSGVRATLLAHPTAVQLLCTVESLDEGTPRRQIGFQIER